MITRYSGNKRRKVSELYETLKDCKFVLRDCKMTEDGDFEGVLVASSNSEKSYDELCDLLQEVRNETDNCVIDGFYEGSTVGYVQTEIIGK